MKYLDLIDNAVGLGDVGDLESISEKLSHMELGAIFELVESVGESLPKPTTRDSPYCFVGNTEMSGFPYPCSSFSCRDSAMGSAAAFAAMYADEVVLFNPFVNNFRNFPYDRDSIRNISYYISKLISLYPLIDRGIVTFIEISTRDLCQSCFARGLAGVLDGNVEDNDIYFMIIKKFLDEVEVRFNGRLGKRLSFAVSNSQEYTGHFNGGFIRNSTNMPRGIGPIKKNQILTKDQIVKLGIPSNPARYLSSDIIQSNETASMYKIQNISTTTRQIDIIKSIFGNDNFSKKIDIAYPFMGQQDIRSILKFRDQEWHHLHDFRKILDDGVKSGSNVVDLFRDEEAKMEKIVQKARRSHNRNLLDNAGKAAFHAAAAVATGGISAVIAAISAAFGGKHLADSLIPAVRERFQEPEALRDSNIYYVWKMKERSRRH